MREMPSATESTVPTSDRSAPPSSSPSMRCLRMLVISSGLICTSKSPYAAFVTCFRSCSSLLRTLASSTMFPTRTTSPPSTSGSTLELSSTRLPGLLLDALADVLHEPFVQLHGARDAHRQQLVLLGPEVVEHAPDPEQDRHPVALREQLEEVDGVLVGVAHQALDSRPSSPPRRSRARRRRAAGCGPGRARRRTRPARRARGRARRPHPPPRRAPAHRPRRSPPCASYRPLAFLGQGGEVDLAERLLHEAALVVLGQRLARDLLGGRDRQVGDLAADLLERAPRLRLDVAAGGGQQLLALLRRPAPSTRRVSDSAALRARATMSSDCSRASLRRARYSSSSSSASRLVRGGRLDRVVDRLAAPVERLGDARERDLVQHVERHAERDQRPDHHPELDRDERVAPALLRVGWAISGMTFDELHWRPRGRRR